MLIVDSREYEPLRKRVLDFIPTAQVEYLPSSDYLFFDEDGHSLAIERKEINDLLNSIARRKLKRQVESLRQYDRGILLIEGNWRVTKQGKLIVHEKAKGWSPQAVQAILLALQEQTGVKVLHVSSFEETLLVLRMFDRRSEKGCFWGEGSVSDE